MRIRRKTRSKAIPMNSSQFRRRRRARACPSQSRSWRRPLVRCPPPPSIIANGLQNSACIVTPKATAVRASKANRSHDSSRSLAPNGVSRTRDTMPMAPKRATMPPASGAETPCVVAKTGKNVTKAESTVPAHSCTLMSSCSKPLGRGNRNALFLRGLVGRSYGRRRSPQ